MPLSGSVLRVMVVLVVGVVVAVVPGWGGREVARAASVVEVTGFGSNPGALRMFRYVPDGLPAGRPLVVALHGCTQTAGPYGTGVGWTQLADRHGFAVLLPQQETANNGNRCFNWFQGADTARGQGEALSIRQMVARMAADFGTAPGRVYVTGLSAGGAMTAVMMAAYPDVFAGGGVVAGVPYRCATALFQAFSCMNPGVNKTPAAWGDLVRAATSHTGPWPTLSVWHGTADFTVAPANQRELVEQWTNVHGTDATPDTTDTVAGYPHEVYRDGSGAAVVQSYRITGMGHGQPVDPGTGPAQCGTAGAYILDVNVCAAHHLATTWGLT